eukprot:6321166-Pyramimonas_sp.AAC.1
MWEAKVGPSVLGSRSGTSVCATGAQGGRGLCRCSLRYARSEVGSSCPQLQLWEQRAREPPDIIFNAGSRARE